MTSEMIDKAEVARKVCAVMNGMLDNHLREIYNHDEYHGALVAIETIARRLDLGLDYDSNSKSWFVK